MKIFLQDTTSIKRVVNFFTCLEMLVIVTQYRGTVGKIKNRNFGFWKKLTLYRAKLLDYQSLIFQTVSSNVSKKVSVISLVCNCSSFTKV